MVTKPRIAIIPARGGSKRIPRKNIVDFHGKPMIAWTIEAALRAQVFDRVMVSTDDAEIAAVARDHGAWVPFLRDGHSDDITPVSTATIGSLQRLRSEYDETYDVVVQLMANCPIRDESHILAALEHFERRELNSQISCFKFGWMNPWWAAKLSSEGNPIPMFPEALTARSQDLPELYCPTGAIWIARTGALFANQTFHSADRVYFPVDWQAAVDIDDMEDLRFAECVHSLRHRR